MMKTRQIIFVFLMLLLVLPAIQQYTGFIPEKPLKGAITEPVKPELTFKSWFNVSFQESYDDYLEQGIGFRPTLIRINNQIAYTLFDTALANSVIIGKNSYLYEINYIKAYEGTDFIGHEKINEQVGKARHLQDLLESRGKHFFILFAPGKASFYPEYIPEKYRNPAQRETNYEMFTRACQEKGVHYLDFNHWFVSMKETSPYPLFTRTGIHWSLYGVALAVDSLVRYMEKTGNIDMVDFGWDGIELSNEPRDTDNDIAEGMNLLFPIPSGKLAYPNLRFGSEEGKVKPDVLVIGDSYYWNIMGSGIASRLFDDNNFWFYNQEAHNPAWAAPKPVNTLNLAGELGEQDFIFLIVTEANLFKFPFGFFDSALTAFTSPPQVKMTPEDKEKTILGIIQDMRKSKETMDMIREKAAKKNVSVEEMLRLDAGWIFEHKYGNQ